MWRWRPASGGLALGLLLALLISRPWLEAGMAWHMGVQIPLLVVVGALLAGHWRARLSPPGIRRYRATLLLFALFTLALWMLPRLLDAALHQLPVELAKWFSLPLAGAALRLAWPHLPVILRGVLHLEAIATLLRLGWLYLQAPERYCVSYGIGDQQSLGYLLVIYGALYGGLLAIKILFLPGGVRPLHVESSNAKLS
ncbi:hypothetical protein [Thiohalophilus thiocyanatoxydans]|uniref:Transmembrane protein n=1 Tax=Thiohalophilus thiocyanatoxydans TaxID=381308 RepID=A0A4R8IKR8_9GAMM|nr:hypothetical protein [Thiohalophilus thiocyanatoxydans]TDX99629.1 hypothetical protein EDC23_2414 [Thiohalophilus thiocyanatoxydans]